MRTLEMEVSADLADLVDLAMIVFLSLWFVVLWFTLEIISKLLAFGNYKLQTSPKIRVENHLLSGTGFLESVSRAIGAMVNGAASLALEDPLSDFVALAKACIRIGHVLLNVDADFDRALHRYCSFLVG